MGEATGAQARRGGAAEVRVLGADVDGLIGRADELSPPCLYCRGLHTRGDLAARLETAGIPTDEVVLYDARPLPLTRAADAVLSGSRPVVLPLFSPRSARLLAANPIAAPVRAVAISDAVAEAWNGPGDMRVAQEPTAEAMVRAVVGCL